ncbi:hypothetical protein [Verrucosispora sp. WMMD573]|uniref:hypothetical protein n=1 Tax=Verrucosispora sp. WMMD573 TaxID=3015149 RepID=UPI00248B48D2|nr:hypothetical protein [Verrucosispora sp. WMMD573]WBB54709.1 hypothetical protein O7601_00770 [Verrucosispora sp. WMMD573]
MSANAHAGVTVIYCDGHRCHALRRAGGSEAPADYVGAVREAVRSSRNAVLIRAGCLGACHRAPALLLLSSAAGGRPALIGPIETPRHRQAVVDLIREADLPLR